MKARLLIRSREVYIDGAVAEMTVWHVPKPVPPSTHEFKYRLAYVVDGRRVIGYDNERGKGDHRHDHEHDSKVTFTTIEDIILQFVSDVEKLRRQK